LEDFGFVPARYFEQQHGAQIMKTPICQLINQSDIPLQVIKATHFAAFLAVLFMAVQSRYGDVEAAD